MVKVHKMFCIEADIAEFLKGQNASELVNRLLKEHIGNDSLDNMSQAQLQAELDIIDATEAHKKRIQELRKNAG